MTSRIEDGSDYDVMTCPVCGNDLEWVDCWQCGGEGEFDLYEEDAINYAPGEEYELCSACYGVGGYLECPGLPHTKEELDKVNPVKLVK